MKQPDEKVCSVGVRTSRQGSDVSVCVGLRFDYSGKIENK